MINNSALINTYQRLPIALVRGEGVWVWDQDQKRYLDALCGIAVTGLGHNHPKITQAIREQAGQILHSSNLFQIPQQAALGLELARLSGLRQAKSFFSNSGAEAVETGIKLAHLYGHRSQNIPDPKIVVFEGGFHGRTMAAISAGSNPKYQDGFEPLLPGFIRVPFNDLSAIQSLATSNTNIAAVLIEPIQGESGIRVANLDYLRGLRQICQEQKWLLMIDEVQCGMGRTGKLFAYQHADILPDVMLLAKGLANGVPIGACVIAEPYASLFTPGSHGSTFGGNHLACHTALATLAVIEQAALWNNAGTEGTWLIEQFKRELQGVACVKDIRGKGLMIGIELDKPCRSLLEAGLQQGILFNIAQNTTVRLLPPLILERAQTEMILAKMLDLIKRF